MYTSTQLKSRDATRCAAWSQTAGAPAVLAVAYEGRGAVNMYTEDGDVFHPDAEPAIRHPTNQDALLMAWSPLARLLAVGWQDGAVTLWSEASRRTEETTRVHVRPVTALVWSPDGGRLVSGDDEGKVCAWAVDDKSRGIPVMPHHERERLWRVTHLAVTSPPGAPLAFCYGLSDGAGAAQVCALTEGGGRSAPLLLEGELQALFAYPDSRRGALVGVTQTGALVVAAPAEGGDPGAEGAGWDVLLRLKMATTADARLELALCGPVLAAASDREAVVRMFNLETEDNYLLLPPASLRPSGGAGAHLACLCYEPQTRTLAAGMDDGAVVMWVHRPAPVGSDTPPDADWRPRPPTVAAPGTLLLSLSFSGGDNCLAAVAGSGPVILRKLAAQGIYRGGTAILQDGACTAVVVSATGKVAAVVAAAPVSRVDVTATHALLWSPKRAEVFELLPGGGATAVAGFPSGQPGCDMALYGDAVFRVGEAGDIQCLSLTGAAKQSLAFEDGQGRAVRLCIAGDVLVSASDANVLRLWRLAGREARSEGRPRRMDVPGGAAIGPITTLMLNADGRKVAFLAPGGASPDHRVFVYDAETEAVTAIDCGAAGHRPVGLAWDVAEPRLLAVELRPLPDWDGGGEGGDDTGGAGMALSALVESAMGGATDGEGAVVATLFATTDHGLVPQGAHRPPPGTLGFVGFQAPHLLFLSTPPADAAPSPSQSQAQSLSQSEPKDGDTAAEATTLLARPPPPPGPVLSRLLMPQFAGVDEAALDEPTRAALLDFSLHLALGDADAAYKAVKLIRSPGVWQSMAVMCVRTKRPDVAELCLANMGHARASRAARLAAQEPELEARLAALAVHLGLVSDAESLLSSCGRWDLLNGLHQASGDWGAALAIAETKDRIHLQATHHAHGEWLESLGDVTGAIAAYEAAGTHRSEVPRLLFDRGDITQLEAYVAASGDRSLYSWLARYHEAREAPDRAAALYEAAGDYASQVRLLVAAGRSDAAAEMVAKTQDGGAAFQLAREHESRAVAAAERGDAASAKADAAAAVALYGTAKRYGQAIRLAKQQGLASEVAGLGLQAGTQAVLLDCAGWLERHGHEGKAVLLYKRGGQLARAVEMCIAANLYDGLQQIADDLGPGGDPALLGRCADFFEEQGQYAQALHLCVLAKQVDRALEMAVAHDLVITDDMAEALSPSKTEGTAESRAEAHRRIARIAKKQGSYHLACKKYTQAGDKAKAMAVLLKSGDTQKIIFFAGVSRQADLYIMAANYLQTLNWLADAELRKSILQFYDKAKAAGPLAGFYESWAQIEVDDFRNYDGAADRLRDAAKALGRPCQGLSEPDRLDRLAALSHRLALTERFAAARRLRGGDPGDLVRQCDALLDTPDLETAVRAGDVYAELVAHHTARGDAAAAHATLERMRAAKIYLAPYVDAGQVASIYAAVGRPVPDAGGGGRQLAEDNGMQVGEEIVDSVDAMGDELDEQVDD